ncbi:translation elongation factor Ts [Nitratifractor sp.]|uniref:translation elongation factor Ts n=1 Tax=Nitratifractor sp. TaxID=2268144 RepID=UPI0025F678DD|nr:translation elongation factor Ts [Nitratifractor sp.]
MANFGPKDIKKLREMTDAGMMDCKQALTATDGDMDAAVEWLRKKGLGAAAKKADKVAAEGAITMKIEDHAGLMVEINSQTDFVAKNEKFQAFAGDVVEHAFAKGLASADEILESEIDGQSFKEYLALQIATIGENLVVRRVARIEGNENVAVNGYVHAGGRVGVLVAAECDKPETCAGVKEALKNIAMHAAAMNPSYLDEAAVPAEVIEKEKEIAREQLLKEGKPENILEKILPGKIKRFLQDNTLANQKFVMDDKISVAEYLDKVAKEAGGSAKLVDYIRFELGEGVEKVEEDFAAEVAKQMGK